MAICLSASVRVSKSLEQRVKSFIQLRTEIAVPVVSISASQVSRLYLHGIFWEELNILYLLFHERASSSWFLLTVKAMLHPSA